MPETISGKIEPARTRNLFRAAFPLGAAVILAALSVGFGLRHWSKPIELPARVLDFAPLTSDGQAKMGRLLTDGARIYFSEVLPTGRILAQVSTKGGETTTIPTTVSDPRPADISPDGTELLILSGKTMGKHEVHEGTMWILPVAGGSARPVGNVLATDAVWGETAETILYSDGHDLYAIHKDGSSLRKLLVVSGYIGYLRWSPDKQRLRFTVFTRAMGGTSSIWEVSANGFGLHEIIPGLRGSLMCCGAWLVGSSDFLFQSTREGRTDLWELPGSHSVLRPGATPSRLTAGPMNFSGTNVTVAPSRGRPSSVTLHAKPMRPTLLSR